MRITTTTTTTSNHNTNNNNNNNKESGPVRTYGFLAPPFFRAPFSCLKVDTLFSERCSRLQEVLFHLLCVETIVKWSAL